MKRTRAKGNDKQPDGKPRKIMDSQWLPQKNEEKNNQTNPINQKFFQDRQPFVSDVKQPVRILRKTKQRQIIHEILDSSKKAQSFKKIQLVNKNYQIILSTTNAKQSTPIKKSYNSKSSKYSQRDNFKGQKCQKSDIHPVISDSDSDSDQNQNRQFSDTFKKQNGLKEIRVIESQPIYQKVFRNYKNWSDQNSRRKYPQIRITIYEDHVHIKTKKRSSVTKISQINLEEMKVYIYIRRIPKILQIKFPGQEAFHIKCKTQQQFYPLIRQFQTKRVITDKMYYLNIFVPDFCGVIQSDKFQVKKKLYKNHPMYDEWYKGLIENQISILKQLNQKKNVLQFVDFFETQTQIGFSTKKVEGISLEQYNKGDLLNKLPQKPTQAQKKMILRNIWKNILQGLHEIHSNNIIHRDISPRNIIITPDYDAVIINFGSATKANENQPILRVCGTPGYIAPEIIDNELKQPSLNPMSDIYSLGLIFIEIITTYSLEAVNKDQVGDKSQAKPMHQNIKPQFTAAQLLNLFQFEETQKQILNKMCHQKFYERISAEQLLKHKFFQDIDEGVLNQLRKKRKSKEIQNQKI